MNTIFFTSTVNRPREKNVGSLRILMQYDAPHGSLISFFPHLLADFSMAEESLRLFARFLFAVRGFTIDGTCERSHAKMDRLFYRRFASLHERVHVVGSLLAAVAQNEVLKWQNTFTLSRPHCNCISLAKEDGNSFRSNTRIREQAQLYSRTAL